MLLFSFFIFIFFLHGPNVNSSRLESKLVGQFECVSSNISLFYSRRPEVTGVTGVGPPRCQELVWISTRLLCSSALQSDRCLFQGW